MLAVSLSLLIGGDNSCCSAWLLSVLSFCFVAGCVWQWFRFLRGKVLFETNENLVINGGELMIPEFASSYELWLFSGGWFTQYNGTISITTSTGETYVRKLQRRIPPFQSLRRSPAPIVMRLHGGKCCKHGASRVLFQLSPTFAGTMFDVRSQMGSVESITAIIKAA